MDRREEGYRYVRQYWTKAGRDNWALFERRDGRMRRVGTAHSREGYLTHLFPNDPLKVASFAARERAADASFAC